MYGHRTKMPSQVHQAVVLCVVVHLVLRRNWPPYVTKNVTLVSGLSEERV